MLFLGVLRLLGVAAIFLGGFAIEKALSTPHKLSVKGRIFNCVYTAFFELIDLSLGVAVAALVASLAASFRWSGLIPLGEDHGNIWLSIPLAFFGVIVADFFYYWFHRLQHFSPWLWAEHELHHSDECMNVTTALRHHWLERPLYSVFITLPMTLVFKPPVITVAVAVAVATLPGYFVHLNSRIRFGWLNYLFACPQSHRVHHSKEPQHIDKNFAVTFALWDVIFGTFYYPAADEWPSTGLVSGRKVSSIPEAVVMPFQTWVGMIAERTNRPNV